MAEDIDRAESVRRRVQGLSDAQQTLERHLAREIRTDHAGLMVMNHLIGTGPATPTQLAAQLEISPAAMTLVLRRLEDTGHISREHHATDRRKIVITARPASQNTAIALVQPLVHGIQQMVHAMSITDQRLIENFLDQLTDVYNAAAASRPDQDAKPLEPGA